MRVLFGTDGIRGIANDDLNCDLAFKVAQAGAAVLTNISNHRPVILIGKDPRISSDMLESAMISGFCSVGADVMLAGVIPTPAIAYLVKKYGCDAGVMISASHNPMEYNGIKFFSGEGYKLSDEIEEDIEEIVLSKNPKVALAGGGDIGKVIHSDSAKKDYVDFLVSVAEEKFSGLNIAVDCANGAAFETAPMLFKELGASAEFFNVEPDGVNINDGCGSTHAEQFAQIIAGKGFDLGITFDGDADRCILIDSEGEIIDGDRIMAVCANHLKEKGRLNENTAVVTVLSNMGFHKMAKENGINVVSTAVGDRYVLEEMLLHGYSIGGEQSGHIIFLDHAVSGDGELTAVKFLSIMQETKKSAKELASIMRIFPQTMINVKVKKAAKSKYAGDAEISKELTLAQDALGDDGRVIIRPSGTEDLIRVMVEGSDFQMIDKIATDLSKLIASKYGI